MRIEAHSGLKTQASAIKKQAQRKNNEVKLGSVVHVGLSDVDSTKVDGKNLTLVVVKGKELSNKTKLYRLTCAQAALSRMYPRKKISLVAKATRALMGLEEAYLNWAGTVRVY